MCGEKTLYSGIRLVVLGSPPRVRGKGEQTARPHYHMRITPACAGKSCRLPKSSRHFWDHPRVCGEKNALPAAFLVGEGSPPRVRGKDYQAIQNKQVGGITPACAGKSCFHLLFVESWEDHPRVCGEKKKMNMRKDKRMGSPPRVRGKGAGFSFVPLILRITPACAGKRSTSQIFRNLYGDHPRVCGEKAESSDTIISYTGSPPRVRGKVKDSGAAKTP